MTLGPVKALRAFGSVKYRSATAFCSGERLKIADRYCVPV